MTTTVTVPVEPTEAMMRAWHRSAWPQGPEVSPMSQAGLAFKRHYAAMLSAAPAPEGGAVERSVVNFDVEEYVEGYEFAGDEGFYTPTEDERALLTDAIHGVLSELSLATSEEAPAPYEGVTEDRRSWPPEPWGGIANAEWHEAYSRWHGRFGPAALARREARKAREEATADHVSDARQMVEATAEAGAPVCLEIPLSNHMRVTEQHDPVELIDLACRATGYMGHDDDCTVNIRPLCNACSCGMRAVMTEIQTLRDSLELLSDPQQLEGEHG